MMSWKHSASAPTRVQEEEKTSWRHWTRTWSSVIASTVGITSSARCSGRGARSVPRTIPCGTVPGFAVRILSFFLYGTALVRHKQMDLPRVIFF